MGNPFDVQRRATGVGAPHSRVACARVRTGPSGPGAAVGAPGGTG